MAFVTALWGLQPGHPLRPASATGIATSNYRSKILIIARNRPSPRYESVADYPASNPALYTSNRSDLICASLKSTDLISFMFLTPFTVIHSWPQSRHYSTPRRGIAPLVCVATPVFLPSFTPHGELSGSQEGLTTELFSPAPVCRSHPFLLHYTSRVQLNFKYFDLPLSYSAQASPV